ncbi:MAG: hypothetical protein ACOZNI_31560 [Myxococcota bacterium]
MNPETLDLVFTVSLSAALVAGAAVALLALPWTDGEVARTVAGFRGLVSRARTPRGALLVPSRAR